MADSTSHLALISASQSGKELTANALFNAASPSMTFGYDRSNSAGLYWGYFGGRFRKGNGDVVWRPNGQVVLTGSTFGTQNYIEVNYEGVVSVNTTGFTVGSTPLYTVWTVSAGPSSYVDYRTGRQAEFKAWDRLVLSQAYASSISVNLDSGADIVRILLTGNATINLTGGGDGQLISLEISQDSIGSRIVTWGSSCRFSTGLPSVTLSNTPYKMDRIGFICMLGSPSRYDCVAYVGGY